MTGLNRHLFLTPWHYSVACVCDRGEQYLQQGWIIGGSDKIFSSSPCMEEGNRSGFRNVVFHNNLEFRTVGKVHKPGIMCETPSSAHFRIYIYIYILLFPNLSFRLRLTYFISHLLVLLSWHHGLLQTITEQIANSVRFPPSWKWATALRICKLDCSTSRVWK
jgi:hypothetical protein